MYDPNRWICSAKYGIPDTTLTPLLGAPHPVRHLLRNELFDHLRYNLAVAIEISGVTPGNFQLSIEAVSKII